MPTISFSTQYVSSVTDSLTVTNISTSPTITSTVPNSSGSQGAIIEANTIATQANFELGSFFSTLRATTATGGVNNSAFQSSVSALSGIIVFQNSTNQTLISYNITELTRTLDGDGYVVISNFPPKIPSLAGTISTMKISSNDLNLTKEMTFSVGAPAGGADIQFADRDLVTNQPWRLDGNVKFRVPVSYEYTV